jgi:N-acetylglucosaminyl-diphospho-decaprenol L-rhamnosyltransferase
MAQVDVATVIVNFRTPASTIEAVRALSPDLDELHNPLVVVVDNASGDGSLEQLREAFSDPSWKGRIQVVDAGRNGGFGSGVNVGVQHALRANEETRFIYVLNPDAMIERGALLGLVKFMADRPDAGLVGNVVRNEGADVVRAFRFPSALGELEGGACLGLLSRLLRSYVVPTDPGRSTEVDWVCGASMLFRSEVFSTVGFFDEEFFLYFEEVDFAKRLREAGWKNYYVADIFVDHVGGLSTGFKDETRRMPQYWFDSRRRYFVKHHGRLYAAACDAARIFGHAVFKAKVSVSRKEHRVRPHFGRDLFRHSLANLLKPAPADAHRS